MEKSKRILDGFCVFRKKKLRKKIENKCIGKYNVFRGKELKNINIFDSILEKELIVLDANKK